MASNDSENLLKEARIDEPQRGWQEGENYILSLIFIMEHPVLLDGNNTDDVNTHWVFLSECRILEQVDICSMDTGTPIGWQLDEKVHTIDEADLHGAIKWFAESYEPVGDLP